ncbi:MAG: hypothetical protein OEZ32_09480 [Nitrospinota bacterium]|nr:hypothetical protein [Nitrospinota bacterium]
MNNLASKILFRLVLATALAVAALSWNAGFIKSVYLGEHTTSLGLLLNGFIFLLFFSGMLKIFIALSHYAYQERQANLFAKTRENDDRDAFDGLSRNSVMFRRYMKIQALHKRGIPINHGAISSITLAEESLYISYPRFVNNILILTGVFGTIISLILALAGASNVLESSVAGKGMWMIISGMNTALTTTGTAIICFFFFTYFYQKLLDAQTNFFGKIEDVTLTYIVPEFAFDADAVNHKIEYMVTRIFELLNAFGEKAQLDQRIPVDMEEIKERLKNLDELVELGRNQSLQAEALLEKSEEMHMTMRRGFRLEE